MLIIRMWNYIRGYVIILVEGYFTEKFLNICSHRQILLWDIERHSNGALTLKISIKGFKLLRGITRKTKCRVRILKKKGLPFVLNKYRHRKAFIFGAIIFILTIYSLTSFIWAVEIEGNETLDTAVISEKLKEVGIKPGIIKYRIDPDRAVNHMMLEIREIAWISIMVKGTKVKISLSERKMPPDLVKSDEPCNIVARRDGIVKSIITRDGMEKVRQGDTVTRGQVLISGEIPIKGQEGKARLVHALGTVTARTWYEKSHRLELKITEKKRTGETTDIYRLVLFEKSIMLPGAKADYEYYDREEIEKVPGIWKNVKLPFKLVIDRYYENHIINKEISIDTGRKMAADIAYNHVLEELPEGAEIIKIDASFPNEDADTVTAVVVAECLEEIGLKERIGGN